MKRFDAPKGSPVLIALAKLVWPAVVKLRHGDTRLEIVGDGLARFQNLRGKNAVICPNHPSLDDADMIFALSRALGENFNFLMAWETFHTGASQTLLLQSLGCYSIIRGAPDPAAFKATRDLIASGKRKLVIFPEGEISHENDMLLPLKPGAAQISFAAMEKRDGSGRSLDLFVLPVALKYTYRENICHALDKALSRLEQQLSIERDGRLSLYARIKKIAGVILAALESEYNCKTDAKASLNERIVGLRATILRQVAASLQVDLPPGRTQLEWAHMLQSILYEIRYCRKDERAAVLKMVAEDRAEAFMGLSKDIHRVLDFISIYEGYIGEPATQEQLAEVIDLIEQEVFGQRSSKGPRSVLVDIGEPINLKTFYRQYKADKAAAVRKVTNLLSSRLAGMLHNLDLCRQPVYVSRFANEG